MAGWLTAGALLLVLLVVVAWHVYRVRDMATLHTALREETEKARRAAEEAVVAQRAHLTRAADEQERREARLAQLADVAAGLRERQQALETAGQQLELQRRELEERSHAVERELERVAGLSMAEAYAELMAEDERNARLHAATLARDIEQAARRDANARARRIIATAIQRCAAEQTTDSVVATVQLQNDDMKGRVIGREGRNIRAFEQITGVNVVIDDTPNAVALSSFDPVRREIARLVLEELVADGRIHPARIEEVYERTQQAMELRIVKLGEDALAEVGITDLDSNLVPYVGALAFRTSYGQNVLRHLVEASHIAGLMAAELQANVAVTKRAAFLHDIGKALTHEHEGPHAQVGAELLRRHGERDEVVHAVEAHHGEIEPTTVEAVLVQAADAISGSRPGARREAVHEYVKRMRSLEDLASSYEGVEKVYAMQAGRDLRIMVQPDVVDDALATQLASTIAQRIEADLTYPGQIKVTVVRESRASATAS